MSLEDRSLCRSSTKIEDSIVMPRFSLTSVLIGLCVAYIGHTIWTMYTMFHVPQCTEATDQSAICISSWLFIQKRSGKYNHEKLSVSFYGSTKSSSLGKLLHEKENFDIFSTQEVSLNISRTSVSTSHYYLHMILAPSGVEPLSDNKRITKITARLTEMSVPKAEAFNLMGEDNSVEETSSEKVLHWKKRVIWSVMSEDIALNAQELPPEIFPYINKRIDQETRSYLPIVMVDHLSSRLSDLERMKQNAAELPLTIVYQPVSAGKLKLWTHFELAFKQLGGYGFGEKEIDEVKGILVDTNIYFLLLTFIISALHILFDTLSFKNDISYWRKRENMVGLSTRVVMWRCVSTIIIFFYLLDSETSLLVLVPTGISALIEIWKLKKALKITLSWSRNPVTFGSISDKEKETEQFDATAMKYLSYALYPLVACGAVYSLLYTPHKSWYSWCLQSLVNGVYAFGFLFMLPQLFVNYKLKSVAHLPWRAFMYKAFNTFIDDVFAFIITMPTAHRVACFRDDLVFLVYLYQRWLYPVDKTRVNEFGQSFDGEGDSMSIGSKQKSE